MIPGDYDPEVLKAAEPEEQCDIMEGWFRQRFEDPAERTPYESAEGGYIWIWGGPYNARDELEGEFTGLVPQPVIERLVDSLEMECFDWAPTPSDSDYDTDLFDAVSSNAKARETFDEATATLQSMLTLDVPPLLRKQFHRLLYANAVTILETYLSDTFIKHVMEDEERLKKYLRSDPAFGDRKLALVDALDGRERVLREARKELLDTVWHNLGKVKRLYSAVLGASLGDVEVVGKGIAIRHDIVHRNGKDKDGKEIVVDSTDILTLIEHIREVTYRIDMKLDFDLDPGDLQPPL